MDLQIFGQLHPNPDQKLKKKKRNQKMLISTKYGTITAQKKKKKGGGGGEIGWEPLAALLLQQWKTNRCI